MFRSRGRPFPSSPPSILPLTSSTPHPTVPSLQHPPPTHSHTTPQRTTPPPPPKGLCPHPHTHHPPSPLPPPSHTHATHDPPPTTDFPFPHAFSRIFSDFLQHNTIDNSLQLIVLFVCLTWIVFFDQDHFVQCIHVPSCMDMCSLVSDVGRTENTL